MKRSLFVCGLLLAFSLNLFAKEEYPLGDLIEHRKIGSMVELVNKYNQGDIQASYQIVERVSLSLDLVSARLDDKDGSYGVSLIYSLPVLRSFSQKGMDSRIRPLELQSLIFRIENLPKADGLPIQERRVAINDLDCSKLGQYNIYCNKPGDLPVYSITIEGTNGTHERRLDEYLRTVDFTKYNTVPKLEAILKKEGFKPATLDSFKKKHDLQKTTSAFMKAYLKNKERYDANPKFYLKDWLGKKQKPSQLDVEKFQEFSKILEEYESKKMQKKLKEIQVIQNQ